MSRDSGRNRDKLAVILSGNDCIKLCDDNESVSTQSTAVPDDGVHRLDDAIKDRLERLSKDELVKVVKALDENPTVPLPEVIDDVIISRNAQRQQAEDLQYGSISAATTTEPVPADTIIHHAMFTPLRLTAQERHFLRLLESALNVSEYTDKIDIFLRSRKREIVLGIRNVLSILSGLALAHDYEDGQKLVKDRGFTLNKEFFQGVFEIGRRYKMLNPERMRNTYGQMVYLLMDSKSPQIQELVGFDCVKPVQTVYDMLKEKNALDLLSHELLPVATRGAKERSPVSQHAQDFILRYNNIS
eukprot:GHVN01075028.1.p2 GENE.GHVN01075028.1~~GHVN01075028.1.p2  ORF type:complete len:301 (+),score=39.48 GHVN01075028.1:74-976(+)